MALMKGSEVMRDVLRHYEVEYVYGIPGATEIWFMDILEKTPDIQYILGLNESVCVGMAEGYARTKGKPAVLNLHTAPGMAAAMALLTNCVNGNVPMVVTVGQNDSRFLINEPQLAGDITGMGKCVSKYSVEITRAEDIGLVLHRAFKVAMQPPMGPVIVSIPGNLLNEVVEYSPRYDEAPFTCSRGDLSAVEKAAELIKKCKTPVMLVQEGVAQNNAVEEVTRLAELAGVGVYQIWMGDVNFPMQHPLNCGDFDSTSEWAEKLLDKADLLIDVGGKLFNDAFYSGRQVIKPDLDIIHIHDDPWEVGKNFRTSAGIVGNPKTVLAELNALLDGDEELAQRARERTAVITEKTQAAKVELEKRIEEEADCMPIAISHLMNTLRRCLPENVLLLDDSWSSSRLLRSILDINPGSFCRPRNGGSIGFGIPGAMGMKQACPEKPVVAVVGDGSAAWCIQALWTAAHYSIPVTFIITNNATYRQVKLVRGAIMGPYPLSEKHLGMEIDNPVMSFVKISEGMGVPAVAVTDPREIENAIKKGIASDSPNLIEVYVQNADK